MELRTKRLVLREFTLDDAPATNAYERDPEVARYGSDGPRTLEQSRDAIARSIASAAESPRTIYDLAVCLDGALVGRAGFALQVDAHASDLKLWYVLHPAQQGRGLVAEACRALLDFAFDTLHVHRAYVDIDPRNLPSLRVAERLGLRREATFVENYRTRGEWADSAILAILDREWRLQRMPR